MARRKVFCSACGHETEVNADREFFFCPECGNKVIVLNPPREAPKQSASEEPTKDLEECLKEVEFYYRLSMEKKECENADSDPVYYLKAQDLLLKLSTQFPEDYRVWWELCKPVDFLCALSESNITNLYRINYSINEDYFDKALDRAELSRKKELIDQHDEYIRSKQKLKDLIEKEAEKERLRREAEEKLALERQQQEEQKQREEAQRRKEEEQARRRQQEADEQANREASQKLSVKLWNNLKNKDYSEINNTFFTFVMENNQTIVAVFKNISGIMYLNSFRIDGTKANTIYKEQSIAIQFDENGCALKFDKKPVQIKGFVPPGNILHIFKTPESLFVNGFPVITDTEYIKRVSGASKKPLISFSKVFI